jgi:uncharacterized protein YacL
MKKDRKLLSRSSDPKHDITKSVVASETQMTIGTKSVSGAPHVPADFTRALASEIVRNLTAFGKITVRPFVRSQKKDKTPEPVSYGDNPTLLDTSALIDGRIFPLVNSNIMSATLLIPKFVLEEVQRIADSSDPVRRAKGRRGLEVVARLRGQKNGKFVKTKIIDDNPSEVLVDQKLVSLARKIKASLATTDFNLAQVARAQRVSVFNVNDLALAMRMAVVPGEEITIRITHDGKEREQGVGYLTDGTMIIVEGAKRLLNQECIVVITKIHQTPAGQILFARLK